MGGDLAYTVQGTKGQSAVVWLHGFMGSSADWQPILNRLDVPMRAIAVDAPGHGGSVGLPEDAYTMAEASQRLIDVLDREGVDKAALVGYSMGGRWALYVALHHPERVRALVLESASPGLKTAAERTARRTIDADRARRIEADLPAFLADWYRMPLFASLQRHPGLVELMITTRRHNDPRELARSLRGMGTGQQPSLWERLGGLRVHTLALAGELDAAYVDRARQMAARSARVQMAVVPEAGHNVHAEQPDAFAEQLRSFLTLA